MEHIKTRRPRLGIQSNSKWKKKSREGRSKIGWGGPLRYSNTILPLLYSRVSSQSCQVINTHSRREEPPTEFTKPLRDLSSPPRLPLLLDPREGVTPMKHPLRHVLDDWRQRLVFRWFDRCKMDNITISRSGHPIGGGGVGYGDGRCRRRRR